MKIKFSRVSFFMIVLAFLFVVASQPAWSGEPPGGDSVITQVDADVVVTADVDTFNGTVFVKSEIREFEQNVCSECHAETVQPPDLITSVTMNKTSDKTESYDHGVDANVDARAGPLIFV
jgi:hypothetical protein